MKMNLIPSKLAIFAVVLLTTGYAQAQSKSYPGDSRPLTAKTFKEHNLPVELQITPDSTGEKIIVQVLNATGKKIQLSVVSSSMGYLFSKPVKGEQYAKKLDMTAVPDGDYEIEISCGRNSFRKKFSLGTFVETNRKIEIK